jgi:hypothetical protein
MKWSYTYFNTKENILAKPLHTALTVAIMCITDEEIASENKTVICT